MPQPVGNVRARELGLALRRLREDLGLSAEEVAAKIGCSQGKVSRIELAQSKVGKGDLMLLLDTYGITDRDEREAWWELARAGRERGWWHSYRKVITDSLSSFIAFEAEATKIAIWAHSTVPGLLQTQEYARSVFIAGNRWNPQRTDGDVDRLVSARMARQVRLTEGALDLWVVLDESILTRPVGGPAVIAEQLDRLATAAPRVNIQILRQDISWHAGMSGAFTVMSFAEHPSIAFVELLTGDMHVERPEDVDRYGVAFDHIRASALGPEESRALILEARDRFRKG